LKRIGELAGFQQKSVEKMLEKNNKFLLKKQAAYATLLSAVVEISGIESLPKKF